MMKAFSKKTVVAGWWCSIIVLFALPANSDIVVGGTGSSCADDPACFNRLHPDIPMVASADPGERIVFIGRDALDLYLDPDEFSSARSAPREGFGIVHPLTGPVVPAW
jgi:formamidase